MRSDEVITIAGKRGYGKTTKAKEIISKLSRVAIWDPMGEYHHKNAYIPSLGSVDEFEKWLKPLWAVGNVFIFVDEADMVMPVMPVILSPFANKIINLGRHRNIGMGLITRRIAMLNKTAFSMSTEVIMFHHFSKNDIKYIGEFYDDAQKLKKLPKYKYLVFQG